MRATNCFRASQSNSYTLKSYGKSFIDLTPSFLRPNCQNKYLKSAFMSVKKYIYIYIYIYFKKKKTTITPANDSDLNFSKLAAPLSTKPMQFFSYKFVGQARSLLHWKANIVRWRYLLGAIWATEALYFPVFLPRRNHHCRAYVRSNHQYSWLVFSQLFSVVKPQPGTINHSLQKQNLSDWRPSEHL